MSMRVTRGSMAVAAAAALGMPGVTAASASWGNSRSRCLGGYPNLAIGTQLRQPSALQARNVCYRSACHHWAAAVISRRASSPVAASAIRASATRP
jgi:hypothetical protein